MARSETKEEEDRTSEHHGHDHEHVPNGRDATRPLVLAFTITTCFAVFELVGGWLSGSLALLSDSGHMFTDSLALALSLGASIIAVRVSTDRHSFGFYRVEILVALLNGFVLVVVSGFILYEAVQRYENPEDIDAPLMLGVAIVGLMANIIGVSVLKGHDHHNLNVKSAMLHIMGDLLSSVGVIVAGLLIFFYNIKIADPAISVVIGLIIMWGAFRVIRESLNILLEAAPEHVNADDVRSGLGKLGGVIDVHDVHMWTISSGVHAISAHVVVDDRLVSACSGIVQECEELLRHDFGFSHVTIQLEATTCPLDACCFKGSNGTNKNGT